MKTVNIDLENMIKESDKEYRATDNSLPNNDFEEGVTMTMSENIPEPPSEMPSEFINIRMSVPSAQGLCQDSYDINRIDPLHKSNIVNHTDISHCKQSEAQKTSFATNKASLDLLHQNKAAGK